MKRPRPFYKIFFVISFFVFIATAIAQTGGFPNAPAGSQVVADCAFNDGDKTCGGVLQTYYPGGGFVNMADAPQSPSGVYYNAMRNGSSTGDGSQMTYTGSRNMQDMYVGFYWKMSPDFEGYSNGTNKLFFMRDFGNSDPNCNTNGVFLIGGTDGIDGRHWPWTIFWGTNTGQLYPLNTNNPSCGGWAPGVLCYPNVQTPQLYPDTWYLIEAYVKASTCITCNDGIIRWWVNGVLAGDVTNFNYGCGVVNEFVFDHTWDGQLAAQCRQDTGDPRSRDCTRDWYHYMDHLHITAPNCPGGCPMVVSNTNPPAPQSCSTTVISGAKFPQCPKYDAADMKLKVDEPAAVGGALVNILAAP